MREIQLKKALQDRCKEALKNLLLVASDYSDKYPTVLDGFYIPKEDSSLKNAELSNITPFVLVRVINGQENARDQFQVTTEIIVQIFNDDEKKLNGDVDCLLAMNRIRDNILDKPVLENIFQYDGGFKWQLNQEQPFPNWEIQITMNWLIPNTQRSDYNQFI